MDLSSRWSVNNDMCAIIVTYNPDVHRVKNLIKSLDEQLCDHYIIDNSPNLINDFSSERYIWLGGNKGIAEAQNKGISLALEQKYKFVIFFDQDSSINNNFLTTLLSVMNEDEIAISAPVFFDEKYGFEYAITDIDKKGNRKKLYSNGELSPFTTSIAISSGTMVKSSLFELVGGMDDRLFIDYVDTEWCLRCFNKGVKVNIIPAAKMYHSIGDNSIKIGRYRVPVHSPVRRYYRTRNAIHLLRYKHVPKKMAFREIIFSMAHNLILSLTMLKFSYLKYSYFAVVDGILNRWGENKHN